MNRLRNWSHLLYFIQFIICHSRRCSPCLVNSTVNYNYSCRWTCRQQSLEIKWLCTILWHEKRNVEKLYLGCANSAHLLKVTVLPWAQLILKAHTDLIICVHLRQGRKILTGEKTEENVISLSQDLLVFSTTESSVIFLCELLMTSSYHVISLVATSLKYIAVVSKSLNQTGQLIHTRKLMM